MKTNLCQRANIQTSTESFGKSIIKKELGGESEPCHVGSLDTLSPGFILLTLDERGAFVIPVFWMRKMRLGEERSLAQGP